MLQGVKAVIAESFERIHRSNLVGMGILPLRFAEGQNAESLGLDGSETFDIEGLSDKVQPKAKLTVKAKKSDGKVIEFKATALLNTDVEVNYYPQRRNSPYGVEEFGEVSTRNSHDEIQRDR
jgi:aconitate hydratase